MKKRSLGIAIVALLAFAVPGAGRAETHCTDGHVADGDACDWRGETERISGTGVLSHGEYIYSDYVHDDYGANVDGIRYGDMDPGNPVTGMEYPNLRDPASPRNGSTGDNLDGRFRHTGDYGYPPADITVDPFTYFDVADLLEFRTAFDHDALHYYVKLGSLLSPNDTGVSICLDTDRNASTGGTLSAYSTNLKEKLGCEYVVTIWGSGASIYDASTGTTSPAVAAANTKDNFLEADVALPDGAHLGTWRTTVAAGRWDAAANSYALADITTTQSASPGSLRFGPNFYDILFTPQEANSWWRDTTQADDLARHDLSLDHADIDMREVAEKENGPRPRPTGLINFQYDAVPLGPGEGQEWNDGGLGSINYIYRGSIQPGMVFLPSNYYESNHEHRFMYFYHCLNCNQNIWPLGVEDAATPGQQHIHDGDIGTTHIQQIADDFDMIVAGCLQRGEGGPAGYGGTIGERDLRDVYNWVDSHYRLDHERQTFSGMSMGGSTTNAQMTLHPDEIYAALSHSAASTPSRLQNIRNILYTQVVGDTGLDGTSPSSGRSAATAMTTAGFEHLYLEYLGRAHDFNLVYESWPILKALTQNRRLDPNPARVSYQLDASTENAALGVVHDHAYWVSGITLDAGATSGIIDATALPLAYKLPKSISHLEGHFLNPESGNNAFVNWSMFDTDLTGHGLQDYETGWVAGPDVAVTNTPQTAPAGAGTNAFTASFTRLAAVTLSMPRMDIETGHTVTGTLNAADALTLTLHGPWPSDIAVTIDGAPVAFTHSGSDLVIEIPAGTHTLAITS